ncbi:MAG: DUF72 domain-containing protein [Halofilum sp. (in: g-proteobacteria)]|nr:DUF72 domain-containing protein [Halofilum sp. (in: g-proteobacteria)]
MTDSATAVNGARARIGTSGYQYPHWKGRFYPADLSKKRWFEHYVHEFDTVEINNTFYKLPAGKTFAQWREAAPPGFEFALKFSRYGSHIKRLRDPREPIERFLAVADELGPTLGPILVQLPPKWHANTERLDDFLAAAPAGHRWAIEFRDQSWLNEEVFAVLENHGAALCIHDMIERHPRRLTAGWTYLRYHGDHYAGSYSSQFLGAEAKRIVEWLDNGIDVHAFFNNDEDAHAPDNACTLRRLIRKRLG